MQIIYYPWIHKHVLIAIDGTEIQFKSIDELKNLIFRMSRYLPAYSLAVAISFMMAVERDNKIAMNHK
jgi:hypothetical protein